MFAGWRRWLSASAITLFPHGAASLGLGALLIWALWLVVRGGLPQNLDLLLQFGPNASFLGHEARLGRIPLWNPYIGTGMPFLADPGTAAWYLPNWLALLAFSPATAIRVLLLGHVAWSALGVYLCARRTVGASVPGAFVAAAVYAGGPFATGVLAGTLPAPLSAAWLPWAILAWHRCLARPTYRRSVAVAVVLTIQLAAGWPPGSVLTSLALAAMSLWRLGAHLVARRWTSSGRVAMAAALVALLTALLSAIMVIPALEFVQQTHYQESRNLAEAAQADYLTVLSVFGAAGGRGAQESHQFYSSVAVLGLAVVGALIVGARWRTGSALALGTVLAWMLGMGPRVPLFAFLYTWLPGFQVIHVPSRFALLVVLGIALLAARGLDQARNTRWPAALLGTTAPALIGLLALAQLWWSDGYDAYRRLLTNVGRFAGGPYLSHEQEAHLLLFFLGAGALWLGAAKRPHRYHWLVALAALLALDLVVWEGQQRGEVVSPADWLAPQPPAIAADPDARVAGYALHGDSHFLNAFPDHAQPAALPPNLATTVGWRDAQAYGPLLLRRYTRYAAAANRSDPDTHWGLFGDFRSSLLDRLAVRWVLSSAPRWQIADPIQRVASILPASGEPVLLWQPPGRLHGRVLRVVTFLGESVAVVQGTPVAEVEVLGEQVGPSTTGRPGEPLRYVALLRAGVETAEWAYGRSDVRQEVQHRQAPIFRRTRLLSVEGGAAEVFAYVATIKLPALMRVEAVRGRALPSLATVHVEAVSLSEEASLAAMPASVSVVERPAALPRARWVPSVQMVPDATAAVAAARAAETTDTVFVEGGPIISPLNAGEGGRDRVLTGVGIREDQVRNPPVGARRAVPLPWDDPWPATRLNQYRPLSGDGADSSIRWLRDTPARLDLLVDAPTAGWLVLADAFYPGWEVTVDGQAGSIHAADGLFRAVVMPAGQHEVTFTYRPRSLLIGGVLTLVGLVLAGWLLTIRPRRSLVVEGPALLPVMDVSLRQ